MNKHTFNGKTYEIIRGDDGFYSVTRDDGKSLGCSAAFHGAINAAVSDAYPRTERRTLRARP